MWSTALIGAGAALAALYFAWPLLGQSTLPLSDAALLVRVAAAVLISAALVVWDVRRRHALAKIADLHGIRVAEVPSRATGIVGMVLLAAIVLSFVRFDQTLAYEALVARNPHARREGALEFLERFPRTGRLDQILDALLGEPDYLDSTSKAYPIIDPELRGHAARRVLDKVLDEPPDTAGRNLATFVRDFEGDEAASAARKAYVEDVIPRLRGRPDVAPGAELLLQALAEPTGGARVGLVVDPPAASNATIASLAGRVQRVLEARAPFQVLRKGGEYVPRRIVLRWSADATATRVDVLLFSASGGPTASWQKRYEIPTPAPDAADEPSARLAEAVMVDLLPPP